MASSSGDEDEQPLARNLMTMKRKETSNGNGHAGRRRLPAEDDGDGDGDGDDAQPPAPKRRRGGTAESSSTLSSADSEEMPLQDLIGNGQGSRTSVGAASDAGPDEDAAAGAGQRRPGSMADKTASTTAAGAAAASKTTTLGSSRTVPDHQPGTPHADLHNEHEHDVGPEGLPTAAPLDQQDLLDAIAIRVKQEEGLDDGDLSGAPHQPNGEQRKPVEQLVLGQAVDDEEIAHEPKPRERPAQLEERLGVIRFMPVTSSQPSLVTSIILTGLKNIFQRQLPKMPREYITRLVFDRNHWSLAIVKKGYQVVGGITYRPFDRRAFGEIVFCAITGTEQVRGYGSHLMNHLKDWVKHAHPNVRHFLTYADNYAFGYFKKQGFTKEVTLPRSVWAGYIKDYEGATIMQCTMLPRIAYLDAAVMLLRQKQVILQKIRENSSSHVVHSGRALFGDRERVHPNEVQALREIGWTPEMDALTRRPERGPQHAIMRRLLTDLQNHPGSWAFARPVNGDEVTDYYDVIKEPMDLETMENKLNAGKYDPPPATTVSAGSEAAPATGSREALRVFLRDCQLIFDNCKQYNSPSSNYYRNAEKLRVFLEDRVRSYTEDS